MKRLLFAGLILAAVIVGLNSLRSNSTEEIRLAGVVSANEAIVSSEIPGRLLKLLVTEGDPVRKGQVVAVLVADELEAQRANKRALIEQYSAKLQQGEEQVRLERGRVTSEIDSAMARVKALESERAENVAELEQWKSELERSKELVRQGLVARQQQERNETMVEVAEARLKALDDRVAAARAEAEVYRAGERQIRVAEQQVEQTRAQRVQALAELEQIEVRMGHTELKSPLTGIVSVRAAREGEFVAAGAPVVTVVDLNDTWVRAQVEETYISSLILGQELKVRLASDTELLGKVTFISPEAEFATQRDVDRVKRDIRTFGVKVSLSNPDGRVHPGMTAFVLLPYDGEGLSPVASPRSPVFETTGSPNLVPEASAAPVPTPADEATGGRSEHAPEGVRSEVKPPKALDRPDPGPGNELGPLPATGERDSSVVARDPAAPTRQRDVPLASSSERPEAVSSREAESLSLENLMSRVDSGEATDADLALLEEYLAAELHEESVTLPEQRVGVAPVPEPSTGRGRPSSDPCPDAENCEQAPALRLEAISVIDGKPAAIINGTRVFEGETIGEAQVVRIRQGSVQLRYRGRAITLRF